MRRPRTKVIAVLVLIGLMGTSMVLARAIKARSVTALAGTVAKKQDEKKAREAREQEESYARENPIAEYSAPEPTDPAKRAQRRARSKRHNLRDASVKANDVSKLALTERSPSVNLGGPWSHEAEAPAIPVAESDTVLIGDVIEAKAYLSTDKTSVYSEFTLTVAEVLKDSQAAISIGDSITVERSGGGVRLASGKLLIRGLLGKPLPKTGRRYAFFLKRNDDGGDFSILTAYELQGGQVFPLDGVSPKGDVIAPFKAYQQYKGTDESTFLGKLRALTQSQTDPQGRGGRN